MTIEVAEAQNNKIFQASYPKYLKESLIKKIALFVYNLISFIFFPIAICRFIVHKIHTFMGYYFLFYGQSYYKDKIAYVNEGRKNLFEKFETKEVFLKTPDNVKLNGIFIPGKDRFGKKLPNDAPLLIFYYGICGCYEVLGYHLEILDVFKDFNVLVFNYRGIVKSESIATKKGIILDSESIFQYAKKELKIPKDKIIFYGHSFGGALATFIASKHRNIKLLNDRSFSSVEKAIYYIYIRKMQVFFSYYLIRPFVLLKKITPPILVKKINNFVNKHKVFKKEVIVRPFLLAKIIFVVSQIIAFFISKLLCLLDWNFSPYKIWDKIKGKKFMVYLKKDKLIHHKSSLFKNVKKQENQFIKILDSNVTHGSGLPQENFDRIIQYLKN